MRLYQHIVMTSCSGNPINKIVSLPINSASCVSLHSTFTEYTSGIDCFESFEQFLMYQFFDQTLLSDKRL